MKKTSSNDIMEQTYEALVGRTLSIYDKDNVAEQMCDFFGQDSEISKAFMQVKCVFLELTLGLQSPVFSSSKKVKRQPS